MNKSSRLYRFLKWSIEDGGMDMIFACLWFGSGLALFNAASVFFILFGLHHLNSYRQERRYWALHRQMGEAIEFLELADEVIDIAKDLYPDFMERVNEERKLRRERKNRRPPSGGKPTDEKPRKLFPVLQWARGRV